MNIRAVIASAAAALALLTAASAPYNAHAVTPSGQLISTHYIAQSKEEAAAAVRSNLKQRITGFDVQMPLDGYSITDIGAHTIYCACEETGIGTEGDYLRFSIKGYKCRAQLNADEVSCTISYNVDYYTTAEEEKKLTEEVNRLTEELSLDKFSDFSKIYLLYRYVASNTTYSEDISDPYVYTAYSAVMDHHAVCQGITQLLYRLYNDNGITCRIIAGKSRDNSVFPASEGYHVWLMVKLDDKYYLMDPTWDMKFNGDSFHYFLKGSSDLDSDFPFLQHIPQNDNGLSFPDYNSDEFKARYPAAHTKYHEPSYTLGNINGDSKIDAVDASMILSEYARISGSKISGLTISQSRYADVNHDGVIDAVDASNVLAYYAALSSGAETTLSAFMKSH
ncbi:transglutaminase domain-containing protein [Ruminococcus flavefaciens]|uniref:transglutaminase domain-containing protein n=1 Tax=Ruminococcus flavefaciens TaxID=1265 RepID=UPI0013DCBA62|nr:transglutaminase domain-containing protein [Ruminococcus flavefaciens]